MCRGMKMQARGGMEAGDWLWAQVCQQGGRWADSEPDGVARSEHTHLFVGAGPGVLRNYPTLTKCPTRIII